MIISLNNIKNNTEDYFKSSPIYFLTENIELSKMFSILCGTQCSYGTYIEKELKSFILNETKVTHCEFKKFKKIKKGIVINKDKPLLIGKLPDLIILNADKKVVTNVEIKVRADRSDGKRIPADIKGNEKIKNYLIHNFPDYQVENIVVSLFKPQGHGNIDVWRRAGAEIIFGEEFLKKYFNLNFIDFRKKLNKNVEANNKIILGLINRVKKDTENKIKNNDFTVDEDINPLFN